MRYNDSSIRNIRTNALDKQSEGKKRSKIYSTEKIEQILKAIKSGGEPDMDPFFHGQIEYRDANITYDYTDEEMHERQKCAEDAEYFIEKYCKFKNELGIYDYVQLRPYQRDIIHMATDETYDPKHDTVLFANKKIVLMQSRQTGKTTTSIGIIIHRLLFTKQVTALAVANKRSTSEEIMRKFKEVLKELPFFLKPGIVNLSMKKIRFDNGSILNTAAASKTPATGDSLQLLYIDECALIPSNVIDDYWASVYNTMNSFYNAQIIVSSTPRGKGNLFHTLWTNGVSKVDGWNSKRVDWWEVPGHDDKWAEEKKKDLGPELFAQEMELSFETATSRLVTPWYIEFTTRLKQKFRPIQFYGVPKEICDKILWAPDFTPDMLHKYYLKTHKFLLSIDTAKGIEKGSMGKRDSDYNVINIFAIELMSPIQIEKNRDNFKTIDIRNCVQYKQIGVYLDNQKDEERCAEAAKYITFNILKSGFEDIDDVRILLEMNYNGPNFLNKFKTHPDYYSQLIIKTPRGNINKAQHEIKYEPGFITVKGEWGKGYWCELGAKMMDDRQIIIRQYNDENPNEGSLNQVYNFGKNVNKQGVCKYEGSGMHDDIAVTSFFVSIAGEQNTFRQWLMELLEQQASFNYYKVRKISQMLDLYVDKEVTIDPAVTAAFYRAASPKAAVHYESNGYGSLMRRQLSNRQSYSNGYTYSGRNRGGQSYYNNPAKYRSYGTNRYNK